MYFQVCVRNYPCRSNSWTVLARNKDTIGQYIGFRLSSWQVSTGFTRNLIYKLIEAYCRCVKYGPHTPKYLVHFGPSNVSKFRFSSIFLKVSSGFTPVLLNMFVGATFRDVNNMGPKGPICGPLWTPKPKLWTLVTFSKLFTAFTSIMLQMFICCINTWKTVNPA